MEGDNTNIVEQMTTSLDDSLKGVMPDSWVGNARLVVAEKDLSDEQKETVLEHTNNILEKNDHPADKVAEKVIEKLGY